MPTQKGIHFFIHCLPSHHRYTKHLNLHFYNFFRGAYAPSVSNLTALLSSTPYAGALPPPRSGCCCCIT